MTGCDIHCEEERWLGAAGTCVQSLLNGVNVSTCVCPQGYWGRDEFKEFKDCHVNKSVQNALRILSIGVTALSMVYIVIVFFSIVLKFRLCPAKLGLGPSNGQADESISANSATKKKRRSNKRRRSQTLAICTVCFFFFWTFSMLLYLVPLYLGVSRADATRTPYQNVSLSFAVSSVFTSLWAYAYAWYINLPPLKPYASLFGMNTIYLTKPELIRFLVIVRICAIYVITFCFLYGLNLVGLDTQENRDLLDKLYHYWLTVMIVDFVVFVLYLYRVLDQLFEKMEGLSSEHDASSLSDEDKAISVPERKQLPLNRSVKDDAMRTRKTLRYLLALTLVFGPLFAIGAFLTPLTEFGMANIYLSAPVSFIIGNMLILLVLSVLMASFTKSKKLTHSESPVRRENDLECEQAVTSSLGPSSGQFLSTDSAGDARSQVESFVPTEISIRLVGQEHDGQKSQVDSYCDL